MYNEAISAWALQGFLLCSDATGLVGQDPPGGGGEMGQTDFYATVRGRLPVGRSNLPGILVENNFWAVLVDNKSQLGGGRLPVGRSNSGER